jgi:Uncharacterized protein conserved in bacteria C-term(DUF2220)
VQLSFTESSFKQYLSLTSRSAKDEVHAVLREAQRAGAIELDWDPLAGENGQIRKIKLCSVNALAHFLGVRTHASAMANAEELLAPWTDRPRVQEILTAWRALRGARGRDVESVRDFADALRVIDFCGAREGEDIAVRSASSALFKLSKRLEELDSVLDILTADSMSALRRTPEEVFAQLGLVKHPPAVYIAGNVRLALKDGMQVRVPAPFVGLAPHAIEQIELAPEVRTVLTVENLTVFHEFALGRAGALNHIVLVFTAGMPAPSFVAFYRILVRQASQRSLMHWGDIDPGGFRIAAVLARAAHAESRRRLTLWQMRADAFPADLSFRSLTESEVTEVQRICRAHGWTEEAAAAHRLALGFEQEALPVRLPST